MPEEFVDGDAFKNGMRHLGSAVSLVTTGTGEGDWQGLTASAVCSLSAEPPRLLACINKSAGPHDAIVETRNMCINVLAAQHAEIASIFASTKDTERRFKTGSWSSGKSGAPVLSDCLVAFECRVSDVVDKGTHSVVFGDVVAVHAHTEQAPMIYYNANFGSFGA